MADHKHVMMAALLCAAWLCPAGAVAQHSDVIRETDSMRQRLEPGPLSKPGPGSPAPLVEVPKAASWRKLKPAMTETEVAGVLGAPDRIETQSQTFRWYWNKSETKGWVSFGNESRRVIEWRNF